MEVGNFSEGRNQGFKNPSWTLDSTETTVCILKCSKCVSRPYGRSSKPTSEFTHQIDTHTHITLICVHVFVSVTVSLSPPFMCLLWLCSGLYELSRAKSVYPDDTPCSLMVTMAAALNVVGVDYRVCYWACSNLFVISAMQYINPESNHDYCSYLKVVLNLRLAMFYQFSLLYSMHHFVYSYFYWQSPQK